MKSLKKVIIGILVLLILIPVGAYAYIHSKLNSIHTESDYISKVERVKGITNILLTGTDARADDKQARTDSMIILTIDNKNKSVKLTSLARDTYVQLPGKHKSKLNTAYFWGEDELLFETIESEFGIGIDKIVQIDFNGLMNVVDLLGGIEVDVPENNLDEINKYAKESYKMYKSSTKGEFKKITSPGRQTLNGYQALSFSRVRKVDSAIYRDQRQQEVIVAITDKIKEMPITSYPKLMNTILPFVKTNLTSDEILSLGLTAIDILGKGNNIETAEFPIIDNYHVKGGVYKNAGWVWLYDLNSVVVLKDFIYNNIKMEDNEYLKDNSNIQLNY